MALSLCRSNMPVKIDYGESILVLHSGLFHTTLSRSILRISIFTSKINYIDFSTVNGACYIIMFIRNGLINLRLANKIRSTFNHSYEAANLRLPIKGNLFLYVVVKTHTSSLS